jgi:hypothetical protein
VTALQKLLDSYRQYARPAQPTGKYIIDANRMVFPQGWQELPLWQQAFNKLDQN